MKSEKINKVSQGSISILDKQPNRS